MKPKKIRQVIMHSVHQKPGITIYEIYANQWKADTNTPKKRIDRAIKKLLKWQRIRLDRTNEDPIMGPKLYAN